MKNNLHTGCSAFSNKHWKGVFYPEKLPANKWFEFYCQHFNTIELNGTFYRFPTHDSLRKLYDRSPEGFLFSVKAPKTITHLKRFVDCREMIDDFYSVCETALSEKLACLLFQLPPSFHYSEEKLRLVLDQLNPAFKTVVEFRHESWWTETVFDELAKKDITFCTVSYPGLPERVIKSNSRIYVRLHGRPRLFYSEYSLEELRQLHEAILAAKPDEAYVYFNNTASTAGVLDAQQFIQIAASQR